MNENFELLDEIEIITDGAYKGKRGFVHTIQYVSGGGRIFFIRMNDAPQFLRGFSGFQLRKIHKDTKVKVILV